MNEEWRSFLYPFGFLAQVVFGFRLLVQWLASEKQKASVTPLAFWKLSIAGNLLLFTHSFVQLHFPMALVQLFNSIMSWRNLNLLGPKPKKLWVVLWLMALTTPLTVLLFALQSAPWHATPKMASLYWGLHLFGIAGMIAFAGRFWVQWWQAEWRLAGTLTNTFWWMSLFGAIVSSIYFFLTSDWVNLIGPLLGLIPYSRNLQLMRAGR